MYVRVGMLRRIALAAIALATSSALACAPASDDGGAPADDDTLDTAEALTPGSVGSKILAGCSTRQVWGLTKQLVGELQCMKPGILASLEDIPGVELDEDAFPYLQAPAKTALVAAQRDLGRTIHVNSALRTLPQQYLLYRWYKNGRCGIGLAARVGSSNHEGGVAVDLASHDADVRRAMSRHSFAWLGGSDPVHFDFRGDAEGLQGLSVKAFKRLWNRNHPDKKLGESDGYDAATEAALKESPADGFEKGPSCAP